MACHFVIFCRLVRHTSHTYHDLRVSFGLSANTQRVLIVTTPYDIIDAGRTPIGRAGDGCERLSALRPGPPIHRGSEDDRAHHRLFRATKPFGAGRTRPADLGAAEAGDGVAAAMAATETKRKRHAQTPMQDRAETRRNPNDEGSRPRSMPPRTAFSRSARAPAALHPPSSDCAMSPPCSTRSSVRRVRSTSSGLRHGRDGRRGLADSDLDVPAEPVEAPALPHRAHARGR